VQEDHRVGRGLSFSSVVGIGAPPTPQPQASVPPPPHPGSVGRAHSLAREGVPIPTRGHTQWYSLNIRTLCGRRGIPTKRQVSKRQVSKRPVSKRPKRQVYKTSALQNVRFTKCQVYKTSGLQNVGLQKNIHIYSVLVVGGNPQVLLQLCLQAK
jgi:hypothetical protein